MYYRLSYLNLHCSVKFHCEVECSVQVSEMRSGDVSWSAACVFLSPLLKWEKIYIVFNFVISTVNLSFLPSEVT
jgi:hypothetical protein